MIETPWFERNGHPDEHLLFLHIDSELLPKESELIQEHVKTCWECRARIDNMKEAMSAYIAYKHRVMETATPRPPSGWMRFPGILRGEIEAVEGATSNPKDFVRSFALSSWTRYLQPRVATAFVSTMAILWWLFIGQWPVSASDALLRAERSSAGVMSRYSHATIHQQLSVRVDGKRIQWEIWDAPDKGQFAEHWSATPSAQTELSKIYAENRLSIRQPLSSQGFRMWRESLVSKHDRVHVDVRKAVLEVSTVNEARLQPGQIHEAVLTLRRSDWHPVEQTLRVSNISGVDREYRIEEDSFAVLPWDAVDASVFHSSKKMPENTSQAFPKNDEPTRQITAAGLDEAEVQLEDALHRIGADISEIPDIREDHGQLILQVFPETVQRRQAYLNAIRGIPYVTPIFGTSSHTDSERPPVSKTVKISHSQATVMLYKTDPPLANDLAARLGGFDASGRYIGDVDDVYLRLFARASALRRMAERYKDPRWSRLSPVSRSTLDRIANDHSTQILENVNSYLRLVSPVLDEMAESHNVVPLLPVPTGVGSCSSWREQAGSIATQSEALQRSFRRLFVVEQTDTPIAVSVTTLLRDSLQSRSALEASLRSLCRP